MEPRSQSILTYLSVERGLTARQLARLNPFASGKRPSPITRHIKNKSGEILRSYQYPGTYDLTLQCLTSLFKKKKVGRQQEITVREEKVNHNAEFVWYIRPDKEFDTERYNQDKRVPIDPDNKDHELDCAEVFVSLANAVNFDFEHRLTHWDYGWTKKEREYFHIDDRYHVNYDRHFILDGREYFLEVDRGSKDPDAVKEQLKRYKVFLNDYKKHDATVLFTMQPYHGQAFLNDLFHEPEEREKRRQARLLERANKLFPIVKNLNTGNQILLAFHKNVLSHPLERIWKSPQNPNGFLSLGDLNKSSNAPSKAISNVGSK